MSEQVRADHPHADPGDGRSECEWCGKWVWLVTHSCKGVPRTDAAMARYAADPLGWIARRRTHLAQPGAPRTETANERKTDGE